MELFDELIMLYSRTDYKRRLVTGTHFEEIHPKNELFLANKG